MLYLLSKYKKSKCVQINGKLNIFKYFHYQNQNKFLLVIQNKMQ